MLETYNLIITGRIPSKKNNRPGFANKGRIPLSAAYRLWEKYAALEVLKYKGLMLENVTMQFEFWMPDNRRCDMDNKLASIFDLLVKMQILKDDSWQCVPSFYCITEGIDKEKPRVEIWIRSIQI